MGTLLYPEPKTKPGLYDWLDERLGISDVIALAKHKTIRSGITGAAFRCSSSSSSYSPESCCWFTFARGKMPTTPFGRSLTTSTSAG